MKRLILALTFLAVIYTLDCNNPLLSTDIHTSLTAADILTTPTVLTDLKQCKRLNGKEQCCAEGAWTYFTEKFKTIKGKFEKVRKEKANKTQSFNFKSKSERSETIKEQAEIDEEKYKKREQIETFEMENCTKADKSVMEQSKNKTKGTRNSTGPTKGKKGKGSNGKFKKFAKGDKGGNKTKGQFGLKNGETSGFDAGTTTALRQLRFLADTNKTNTTSSGCDAKRASMKAKRKTRGGKKGKGEVEGEYKKQYDEVDKNLTNANKKMYKAQNKCLKALFRYQAGMMCLTCDANYSSFMTQNGDAWSITIKQDTCNNIQKACYNYLVEAKAAGEVTSDAFQQIKLQKVLDRIELLQMKYDYAVEAGNFTDEQVTTLSTKISDSQTQYNTLVDEFAAGTGSANLQITIPANCTSETDCQFICESFLDYTGVKEESVQLTTISASGSERLLATTITVGYSTSAGYTPDSTDNTEGFDTETFVEDPSSEITPDLSSEEKAAEEHSNHAMIIIVIVVALILLTVVVGLIAACILSKKKPAYNTENPQYKQTNQQSNMKDQQQI